MDLQTLKAIIRENPDYSGNRAVLRSFNEEGQRNGQEASRQIPLAQAAEILGYDGGEVQTYAQHVRFAKRHGLQSFGYRSLKTGRLQTYTLNPNGQQYSGSA